MMSVLPVAVDVVAPVLRGGRGLKLIAEERAVVHHNGSARPSGRARIETGNQRSSLARSLGVAPVLRGGRGLKHRGYTRVFAQSRSARPSGRARIETRNAIM